MSNLDYKVDINSEVTKTSGRQGGLSTKILLGAAGTAAATTALKAGGNKLDKFMTEDFTPKDERKGGLSDFIHKDPLAGIKGSWNAGKQKAQTNNYFNANRSKANALGVNLNEGATGPRTIQGYKDADSMTDLAQMQNKRINSINTNRDNTANTAKMDIAQINSDYGAQNAQNTFDSSTAINDAKSQNAGLLYDSQSFKTGANNTVASNNYDSTVATNNANAQVGMNNAGVDMFSQISSAYDPNAKGTDGVAGGALPDITSALKSGTAAQNSALTGNAAAMGTRNNVYNTSAQTNATNYGQMNNVLSSSNTANAYALKDKNDTNSANNRRLATTQKNLISGNARNAAEGYGIQDKYTYQDKYDYSK